METNTPKETPQAKANSRWQLIMFFLFLAVTVGISLWLMIANKWPASALIDLQAGWFNGEYYPKLTFGIIWILVLLVCVVIYSIGDWLWRLIRGKK